LEGFIKENCDATIFSDRSSSGLGWVCRNKDEIVLSTGLKRNEFSLEPTKVEALAMLSSISCAQGLGYDKIIIESDALVVINEAISERASCASFGGIIEDIKSLKAQFE
ncbi:RVT_3 domain-containing protein, partial [Cephalotus follicularis]